MENDLDSVENAVAYDYSNGFVEETNSRLKMIKRTMYGKCNRELLEAKLRYEAREKRIITEEPRHTGLAAPPHHNNQSVR